MTTLRITFQQFNSGLARLIRPYRWDFYIGLLAAADRILVLDHGRLVEESTHEQLLAAGGL